MDPSLLVCARCKESFASVSGTCVRCHGNGRLCASCLSQHQRGIIAGHAVSVPEDGFERRDQVVSTLSAVDALCSAHAAAIVSVCDACSPLAFMCARCAEDHGAAASTSSTSPERAARHVSIPLADAADAMRVYLLRVCATVSAWEPALPLLSLRAPEKPLGEGEPGAAATPGKPRLPPRAVDE